MMTDLAGPIILTTFPDQVLATSFANLLRESGIQSRVVGDFTSGFQAEAPGVVQLLVSESDLSSAKRIFTRWLNEGDPSPVDWEQVDVGDETSVSDKERVFESTEDAGNKPLQFSISNLIIVQCIVALIAAVAASLRQEAILACVFAVVLVLAIPFASLFGILKITQSNMANQTAKLILIMWFPAMVLMLLMSAY